LQVLSIGHDRAFVNRCDAHQMSKPYQAFRPLSSDRCYRGIMNLTVSPGATLKRSL